MGGISGVIRNVDEDWVKGFHSGFQLAINNHMELLALNEGLKLVQSNNFTPIEINVDSTEVINMLTNGNLCYNSVIDEYRLRLRRLLAPAVQHCYREQNQVTDALAKKLAEVADFEGVKIFVISPLYARKQSG